jgi:hypothetical protein
MRHLSSQSSLAPEMMAAAKKRFTPPPSMAKSSANCYSNQFKQNFSSQALGDKVIILFFQLTFTHTPTNPLSTSETTPAFMTLHSTHNWH